MVKLYIGDLEFEKVVELEGNPDIWNTDYPITYDAFLCKVRQDISVCDFVKTIYSDFGTWYGHIYTFASEGAKLMHKLWYRRGADVVDRGVLKQDSEKLIDKIIVDLESSGYANIYILLRE